MRSILQTRLHAFVFVIAILIISCSPKKNNKPQDIAPSIQDSLALVQILQVDWPKAYNTQDTSLIKKILADNFTVIFSSGTWSDKRGEVDWIANNKTTTDSLIRDIKRFEFLDLKTALVAGTGHVYNEGKHSTYEFTDVFIKKDNSWKATSSHVSGVKDIE